MSDLTIRIKKKRDGSAALTCMRADRSVTWQRQDKLLGRFFPLHDLTHCAVESVLGLDRAFFGLLAEGWTISDFSDTGLRDRLPVEAMLAEVIVGFMDLELRSETRISADECNEKIGALFDDQKVPRPDFAIDERQLAAIRERRDELFAAWRAVQPGDALEVPFTRRRARSEV